MINKKYFYLFLIYLALLRPLGAHEHSTQEWVKTISIGSVGLAAAFGLSFVPTPQCSWCATNKFDNSISNALIWQNTAPIRITSDIMAFGLTPVAAFGSLIFGASSTKGYLRDALVVLDSIAVTAALTELIKISARRARPDSIYGDDHSSQANRSFWSGHTSFTFAALTSASVIAFRNSYPWAPYFAGFSALLGSFVGYSRIAASRHWLSDVLVGMFVGVGAGLAMPFLTLDPPIPNLTISASSSNILIGFAF